MADHRILKESVIKAIKIGDIHYEFARDCGIKCEVISEPVLIGDGSYQWQSKNLNTGVIIDYLIHPKVPTFAPKLYNYKAYQVQRWV